MTPAKHLWLLAMLALPSDAADYHLHPLLGNDSNDGTDPKAPIRTLGRASGIPLEPGDRVLLAAGQRFSGQLAYEGISGSVARPIVISTYQPGGGGGETRAIIDARGTAAGVFLGNCSHFQIRNLRITANAGGMKPVSGKIKRMRCGILIEADRAGEYRGFDISDVEVKDVFFEKAGFVRPANEVKSANGTQKYGWGIRFLVSSPETTMRDITISGCRIENVAHTGLKFTAPRESMKNVTVRRLVVLNTGGPGVQMSGLVGGQFREMDVNGSGSTDDSRKWGRGSGLWTWNTSDVLIERSRFRNANGPGDSAGVHIDYHCRNVIVQFNLSANNAGGFCEILGNNHNCAYRYNVSIGDGQRVKGENNAFQEGKVFWLSGYTGNSSALKGPFNSYFYNNTIFVGKNAAANVSVAPTTRGVLVANNIFHFEGSSKTVAGDQEKRDVMRGAAPRGVVFENNLFLHESSWPDDLSIQDASPLFGNAAFHRAGGPDIADYMPGNTELIRDRGITIPKLPGDEKGLEGGLTVETDIMGNPIRNLPDLGAIELPLK